MIDWNMSRLLGARSGEAVIVALDAPGVRQRAG
jgi:hypothetical protein